MTIAIHHHSKSLMKFNAFNPWLVFISKIKKHQNDAIILYELKLYRGLFTRFLKRMKLKKELELKRAADLYIIHILKTYFSIYQKVILMLIKKYLNNKLNILEASRYEFKKNLRASFNFWIHKFKDVKPKRINMEEESRKKADRLAFKLVPKRVFRNWMNFVQSSKEEKWKAYRTECLRKSVKSILAHSSFENNLQSASLNIHDLDTTISAFNVK
jgi:hypothetical protein